MTKGMFRTLASVMSAGLVVASLAACGGDDEAPEVDSLRDVLVAVIDIGCRKLAECDALPESSTLESCLASADMLDVVCENPDLGVDCDDPLDDEQKEQARQCLADSEAAACGDDMLPASCPQVPADGTVAPLIGRAAQATK
jgi:hypothetical protein